MNCAALESITQWRCQPSGQASIRATAPFTLGESGPHVAFYIAQPSPDSFYITDACETAIYAEQMGIALRKNRLESLNQTTGVTLATFAEDWSIESSGPIALLQRALWDAAKLALALSFKTKSWQPKFAQAKFQATVVKELEAQLGADQIIRQAKVQGISGHTIEFPAAIVSPKSGQQIYVQPVAMENGKVNWPSVYEFHGKLFDVKAASNVSNRIAVIERGATPVEFGRAASFLGGAAKVITIDGIAELRRTGLAV
ncbi:DUF1828 domain-containing protein [Massilia aurea]|uniref:DUF1828 domain-containing protein n=1 Tax=Massilia aurea TaxID=373040 RepID=UPI0021616FA0|nr:DUF1828 domain-containing protein [Massilia aurea]MCS0709443.1 DUF1828 domain-containing protein [Massilia aurea]